MQLDHLYVFIFYIYRKIMTKAYAEDILNKFVIVFGLDKGITSYTQIFIWRAGLTNFKAV
jgi:hypothetical protein